jgi:iron complex transport system substrate-binding protein
MIYSPLGRSVELLLDMFLHHHRAGARRSGQQAFLCSEIFFSFSVESFMNKTPALFIAAITCWLFYSSPSLAEITVMDDMSQPMSLSQPAQRIVSLAPHVTEVLFAAGLGERIIGAVSYSDYPEEAKTIPRVGGYNNLDIERIVTLQPDLVVAWHEGNHPAQLDTLRRMGITVYTSNPHELDDIPKAIERLGILGGTQAQAQDAADAYRQTLSTLIERYSQRPPVSVFYQIWHQPLMTINDQHLIGKVLKLCGGENIFAGLSALTPTVSTEAVLQAEPEVIVASGMGESRPEWLDDWRRWHQLPAVRNQALYFIPPDILQRHGPRILEGATQLCERLEQTRLRKDAS